MYEFPSTWDACGVVKEAKGQQTLHFKKSASLLVLNHWETIIYMFRLGKGKISSYDSFKQADYMKNNKDKL